MTFEKFLDKMNNERMKIEYCINGYDPVKFTIENSSIYLKEMFCTWLRNDVVCTDDYWPYIGTAHFEVRGQYDDVIKIKTHTMSAELNVKELLLGGAA